MFLKTHYCGNIKTLFIKKSINFFIGFCVSNKKKSDGKKLTPTQHLPNKRCGTLPTTILTLIKTDDAKTKMEFQDMCGSKHTLGGPINYRNRKSGSKISELKHTLMHKCTTISASRLLHRFLTSARSGSKRYHIAKSNKISSDRTSKYIDGLMHSGSAGSLNLSQLKDSGPQTHTIHYYTAELFLIL